ncbi:hypothetical protein HERIO_2570 [Hepatospora eriocheir]|uniref:Uncharacterized protein n=1 Tax=Hepatospora eriocheir TaxID=1081669 RepID=A0A1X0Q6F2_9MICR|nr:hypothetical protein HERIO_2570 [Hepatospora eriocheir]
MDRQDRQSIFNEHSEQMLNCGGRDKKEETKVYDLPDIIEESAKLGNVNLLHKKSLSSNIIDNLSISHNQSKYDESSNSVITKVVDGAIDKINESITSDKNTIDISISKIPKISNPLITDRTFSFQDSLDFFKNLSKSIKDSNGLINNEVVDKIVSESSTGRVHKNSQQLVPNTTFSFQDSLDFFKNISKSIKDTNGLIDNKVVDKIVNETSASKVHKNSQQFVPNRTFSFQDSLDFFKNLSKSNEDSNGLIDNEVVDEKCDSIYSSRIDVSTNKVHKCTHPLITDRMFSFQDSLNFFKNLSKSTKDFNDRSEDILYQEEFKSHVNNHDRIKTYQKDNSNITNF